MMISAIHSIFAREVKASHECNILTATKIRLADRPDDPLAQFFINHLQCDEHATRLTCTKILGDTAPRSLLPPWECIVCGCSDPYDIYGELVCRCDSCSVSGCESPESRLARNCIRPSEMHEAGIALGVIADGLDTLLTEYEIPDMVLFLSQQSMPAFLDDFKDDCIQMLLVSYPDARVKIRQGHSFLSHGTFRVLAKS